MRSLQCADPKKIKVSHPMPIQNKPANSVARIKEAHSSTSAKRVFSGENYNSETPKSIVQV